MTERADVLIVGAGIHGASLAYNLLSRGVEGVLVIDKAHVGAGATGRSASFIRHHYSNRICVEIVKESLRIIRHFESEVGASADFQPQPLLLMAGPKHEKALRENVAMHRSLGVDVELLEAEAAKAAYPYFEMSDIALAALERDAGYGDAYQLNAAYAERAKALGGKFLTGTEVLSVDIAEGEVRGVRTSEGRMEADVVVIAAGPWSRGLSKTAGVETPVEPALLSLGVLLPPRPMHDAPMAFDMTTGTYWRPEKGGTVLVGTDEEVEGSWDPDTLPDGVGFEFVAAVSARLGRRWPEMREARFVRGWVGVDGATPDLHPIIGPAPSVDGLYLSTGYSGHGFKFSPAVGKCLAELIVSGRCETLDLSPFSLERFAQGRTFESKYPMAVVQ